MAELKVLKCPNCGANTTNAQNCEYCGSLLVRFVDKGIDLSTTNYLSDKMTIPGLAAELKKNLQLQKATDEIVTTDIYRVVDKDYYKDMSVVRTGYGKYEDTDVPIVINDNKSGLVIVYYEIETLNPEDEGDYDEEFEKEEQEYDKELLKEFMSLPSYPLFTQHVHRTNFEDHITGKTIYYNYHFYAIDFGEDAEGAARLISEIIALPYIVRDRLEGKEIKGFTGLKHLFFTNIGEDNIENSRKSIRDENQERLYDRNPDLRPGEEEDGDEEFENEEYAVEDENKDDDNNSVDWSWVIVSLFFPVVGFILFFVKKGKEPKTAKYSIIAAIISSVLMLCS